MPRLRRSDCAAPGIARRRRGRGFEYRDPDGERVEDPEALERIAELGIPPAWRQVWVCMDSRAHLQATGVDAAGRKQYLYHERWRAHRDRLKFDTMVQFGRSLPRVRRRVARDLRPAADSDGGLPVAALTQELVLACALRLLDVGFFRIGSEDYAEQNASYGLTTMLREHVSVADGEIVFDFPAKSGKRRVQEITDEAAIRVVAALKRRRGAGQLFVCREGRGWRELRAEDVNSYIKGLAGEAFSAKDFRTWNATVLAAVELAAMQSRESRISQKRAASAAIKAVAAYLGNTPAVCRASYVDPRVIDRFREGRTIAAALAGSGVVRGPGEQAGALTGARARTRIERAVIELLDKRHFVSLRRASRDRGDRTYARHRATASAKPFRIQLCILLCVDR
ncbi:MAG: DNA topoisomerase IB [Solirubrobacteraceae bacterium]